ncbi:S-layer homology domain-containing protein [Mesobacillus jeotgali]|uniref:S-layer homology domain-containing protein n=1 Tax=Mesobacillus jeotgali TaxID=129985 RepID=UPI001784828D|nr:S-layer homology domain-containing protein [Mesobacillus jeotgali]UYZ21634.1 S-layer homology domain-containing protein [Mesobacillus jeotgali]
MANRSFNKFLAAGTSAAIVVSAVAPAALAHDNHVFTDVSGNYEEAVYSLHDWGIVNGKSETTFGTNLNLTRGDAAVIMANALGLDIENAPDAGFTDLIPRIEGSVNALAEAGIISGVGKGKFAPNEPLTRGAMAKILVLGFGLEDFAVETPFTDAVGAFGPYIESLYGTEITFGKTAVSFGTNMNITRGDFANLLYRTFMFIDENIYFPYAVTSEFVDSNTLKVTLEEAAPVEYTPQDIADGLLIYIENEDGSMTMPVMANAVLSEDRMTVTFDISPDLAGKKGIIYVDDIEQNFDFTVKSTPVSINIDTKGTSTTGTALI